MNNVRLLLVGGFLGAGKTTALLVLARSYHAEKKRVGLITNDQAADLVDTSLLRVRGFRVEEVAGACFCCKFDELAQAAERIRAEEQPDVLLAEPVGSCTDLAATVVAPLRSLYSDRYSLAPYSVLVDPLRARQLVLDKGFGGFSSKVAYIFQKQLEEAEVICLNKVDLLSPADREALLETLAAEFTQARVLPISALTGEGFPAWRSLLDRGDGEPSITAVDYDLYAEGEAELGWLNLSLRVESAQGFQADDLLLDLIERMRDRLAERGAEVAHLKAILRAEAGAAVVNCVGGGSAVRLSERLGAPAPRGELVLNARVHLEPDTLRATADEALSFALARHKARGQLGGSAHFRPGRPVPTHRFSAG